MPPPHRVYPVPEMASCVHPPHSATPPILPSDLNQASITRRQRGSYPILTPLLLPQHTDCLHEFPRKHSISYELDAKKLPVSDPGRRTTLDLKDRLHQLYNTHTKTTLLTEGRDYRDGLLGKSGPLAGWARKASRSAEGLVHTPSIPCLRSGSKWLLSSKTCQWSLLQPLLAPWEPGCGYKPSSVLGDSYGDTFIITFSFLAISPNEES